MRHISVTKDDYDHLLVKFKPSKDFTASPPIEKHLVIELRSQIYKQSTPPGSYYQDCDTRNTYLYARKSTYYSGYKYQAYMETLPAATVAEVPVLFEYG